MAETVGTIETTCKAFAANVDIPHAMDVGRSAQTSDSQIKSSISLVPVRRPTSYWIPTARRCARLATTSPGRFRSAFSSVEYNSPTFQMTSGLAARSTIIERNPAIRSRMGSGFDSRKCCDAMCKIGWICYSRKIYLRGSGNFGLFTFLTFTRRGSDLVQCGELVAVKGTSDGEADKKCFSPRSSRFLK
ncbi:uncharacterized protein ARMOST_19533 [Armillaria ostoyae]|uniref:Uncharacterized protein n=1 Tax=Armillaria ostoyae TaxID=47428 RepID=A0A284S4S5_ARMOS|nr:uncharacterized protein ARMOST_19533 [Armillaria ostoyae]